MLSMFREWIARAQGENDLDADTVKGKSRAELKRALAEVVQRERERDEMTAHVEEIRKELDVATERHARTCEPIQKQLASTIDAPTRVVLRQKIDAANGVLEAELRAINDRLNAAEREQQYLAHRCIARIPIEGELYRKGDPHLLAQVELHEHNAAWAKSRLQQVKKSLTTATHAADSGLGNADDKAYAARLKLAYTWEAEQVEAELKKAQASLIVTRKQIMES